MSKKQRKYAMTNSMTGFIELVNDLIEDSNNNLDEIMQIISLWDMYADESHIANTTVLKPLLYALEAHKLRLISILDDIAYIDEKTTHFENAYVH